MRWIKNIFQQVFAHELGHSLGMPHDFLKKEDDPRLDESGNSCLGVNGIMSYKVSWWESDITQFIY